ncbi:MAG: hypothetical protein N2317_00315 [Syntrophales bacterium]|nr:hypothetical protein [Syntrophales bacterium]
MKKLVLLIILVASIIPIPSYGQTAIEAIKALKKLEGRVAIGLNYKEYALALADAKVDVELYLETTSAKSNPKLVDQLKKIVDHYENARKIWFIKTLKTEDFGTAFGHLLSLQNGPEGTLGRQLLNLYPEANRSVEKGGALTMGAFGSKGSNEILVDNLINIIWKRASEDLQHVVEMVVH